MYFVESSCDAEPGALADYILALLKHTAPEAELRKELAAQLDEFLEKGASLSTPPYYTWLIQDIRRMYTVHRHPLQCPKK